jgi:predicted RNA-binding protein with RPS1 domain
VFDISKLVKVMNLNEKFEFVINEVVEEKFTIITDPYGIQHKIPVAITGRMKMDLVITDIRVRNGESKYIFSEEISLNNRYKLGEHIVLTIKEITDNSILCEYQGDVHSVSLKHEKRLLAIGDKMIGKIVAILNNHIKLRLTSFDLDSIYNIGELYTFPVTNVVLEEYRGKEACLVYFDIKGQHCRTFCSNWVHNIYTIGLNTVDLIYRGKGKWAIRYDNIACSIFELGKKYKVTIESYFSEGFYIGIAENNVSVHVLPLRPKKEEEIIGDTFSYKFIGVNRETGFLEFRESISFGDVIESMSLKVLAFDNLRKEYKTNETFYLKLFSDYDAENNLWLLTYGKALYEVIDDKINSSEWDIAYLLLEVLIKMETWILKSRYLLSFSKENRVQIERTANQIVKDAQIRFQALHLLIKNDFSSLHIDIRNELVCSPIDYKALSEKLSILIEVLHLDKNIFNIDVVNILQLLKEQRQDIDVNSCREILRLTRAISNILLAKEKNVFNEVFISPIKRRAFFSENATLKQCVALSIWLLSYTDSEDEKYLLSVKTIRYLIYLSSDIYKQEKLTQHLIQALFQKNEIRLSNISNIDLTNIKYDSLENTVNISVSATQQSLNIDLDVVYTASIINHTVLGHILQFEQILVAIPYKKENLEYKKGDQVNFKFLSVDPVLNVAVGNEITAYHTNITRLNNQELEVGARVTGVIKSVVDYGMFVTISGRDALLHGTKVSYNNTDLKKIFEVGDQITVRIASIDGDRIDLERISILQEQASLCKYTISERVKGVIYRIDERKGIYLELENGASGYIRKNEICLNRSPKNMLDFFEIGELVTATIVEHTDGKYILSAIEGYSPKDLLKIIKPGSLFKARLLAVGDIKWQISQRYRNVEWDALNNNIYCPKCQKNQYNSGIEYGKSNLEITNDRKKWHCVKCNYRSREFVVFKFLDFPLTGSCNTFNLETDLIKDNLKSDVNIKIEEVSEGEYITIVGKFETALGKSLFLDESDITNSKEIAVELGYLYEQLAAISVDEREYYLDFCRYCFGMAKMSRSYFHSFLNEYKVFIDSLESNSNEAITSVAIKAKTLHDWFSSEALSIKLFPVLTNILDSLIVLSNIKPSIEHTQALINLSLNSKDDAELLELVSLAIAFNNVHISHIKDEVWNSLKIKLKNNLRMLQLDIDEESIKLKKRIKEIIFDNRETEQIECKGSFEYPVSSKDDLKKVIDLESKLLPTLPVDTLERYRREISALQNPTPDKEIRKRIIAQWVKTIAAFANTEGGELLIGVGEDARDNFVLLGLEKDMMIYKSEDKLMLAFDSLFERHIGSEYQHLVRAKIVNVADGKNVLYVNVTKSTKPIFVSADGDEKFYIRRSASSKELKFSEFSEYVGMRFHTIAASIG